MANSTANNDALRNDVKKMALEGRTITYISKELGISWGEARRYTSGWRGAKVKLTNRLNKLVAEPDQDKRKQMAAEADNFADFLYDAAKHLRDQVDAARRALDR